MKIVVIGGTGMIGSKLVRRFEAHGHEVVAASPNTGVNTLTGEGLAEAMAGASVVVDVSNSPSFEAQAVMDFFTTSTSNQLKAEADARVGHHVAVSIVGTERMPENGYFAAKLAQEKLIKESGVPFSLVHSTQFFEFVRATADSSAQDDGVHIAPVSWQPIAGDDVADQVAQVAIGAPLNGRKDIAGPDRYRMDEFLPQGALRPRRQARGGHRPEGDVLRLRAGRGFVGPDRRGHPRPDPLRRVEPVMSGDFLHELEHEVEADLTMIESSDPAEAAALPPSEWTVDPADVSGTRSACGACSAPSRHWRLTPTAEVRPSPGPRVMTRSAVRMTWVITLGADVCAGAVH